MKLKQKLSSRKFWCAISGFATAVMAAIGSNPDSIAHAAAIIAAAGVLMGYMIGEGIADNGRNKNCKNYKDCKTCKGGGL